MNELAVMQSCGQFTEAEWRQFYRLIGYSVEDYLDMFPDDEEAQQMFDDYQKLLHPEGEGA